MQSPVVFVLASSIEFKTLDWYNPPPTTLQIIISIATSSQDNDQRSSSILGLQCTNGAANRNEESSRDKHA